MAATVAIVGRPNVGKSTLFNRLVEAREAIMDDAPGVTRDRHYGISEWNGRQFTVVDTGGYVFGSEDLFEEAIREQVEIAIEESNLLLFLVDSRDGLTGMDQDFANVLRASKKPVLLVANKADNAQLEMTASEFYALGLGDVIGISAISGSGTGDLLDKVVPLLPPEPDVPEQPEVPRIAVVGRPNVGKSSLVNALLGQQRSVVTDRAGTTRDAIHSRYQLFGKDFILIDTAGIRKKSRVTENVEFYSVMRAIKAMQESDVCLLMIDATKGLESQDMHLIALGHKYRKGMVLLVNKWDLITKDTQTAIKQEKLFRDRLGELDYIPIIFTSVLKKQRIYKAMEQILQVYESKYRRISTSRLNDQMLEEIKRTPPPAVRGKQIKIKYVSQLKAKWPAFAFFCNHPKLVKNSYKRFLENRIREKFGFSGVPIGVFFRKK